MVNKKVMVYLDNMSIDKSLEIVYNIIKDDESESTVMTTAAEIIGIRTEEKVHVLPTGRQFEQSM